MTMKEALTRWLLANGYGEELRGYGHATAEDIAEALLDNFNIQFKEGK